MQNESKKKQTHQKFLFYIYKYLCECNMFGIHWRTWKQYYIIFVLAIEIKTPSVHIHMHWYSNISFLFLKKKKAQKKLWLAINQYACQDNFSLKSDRRLWCWLRSFSSFRSCIYSLLAASPKQKIVCIFNHESEITLSVA